MSTGSAFFQAEWERANEGWSKLTPQAQEQARKEALIQKGGGVQPAAINIPGWDDVIHIAPRTQLDQERVRDHFAGLRRGEPGILTGAELAEMDRRRGVRDRIREAAQPDYSKAFGQVLTAIDNVQDFLITVSVVGRMASWLAVKVAGRAIPGVGWVLLASDILNLLGFTGQIAMPFYALVCHGPTQALAAGVPAAIFGRALKAETWKLANLNPFSRVSRAARRLTLSSSKIGFTDWLQVAQTTDQLWGVGVSLGGLVGVVMDSAYAAEAALEGKPVKVNLPQQGEAMKAIVARSPLARNSAELADKQRAAALIGSAPMFFLAQGVFTVGEHLEFITAYSAALDLLAADLRGRPWREYLNTLFDVPLPPPGAVHPVTEQLLREVDPEGTSLGRWSLPGAPGAVTGNDLLLACRYGVPDALKAFLAPIRFSEEAGYYGMMVNKVTDQLWLLLEEDPWLFHHQLSPQYRVMESLAQVHRWVNVGEDQARVLAFWAAAERKLTGDRPPTVTGAEWDLLARESGITLIRLLPPSL
jgi:hypothetical protein